MENNNWLIEKLRHYSNKIAVIYKNKHYTYNDIAIFVEKYIKHLEKEDIKNGEVVSLVTDYSFMGIVLFIALYYNKNVIVPITANTENDVNIRINESYSDIRINVVDGEVEILRLGKDRKKHILIEKLSNQKCSGLILFSSGSTGRPKAMLHNLDALVNSFYNRKERDSNILVFLMFDHIGGMNTLLNSLASGTSIVVPENRQADYICGLIEMHKVNLLPASPTFLNLLLMSEVYKKYNLSSLKMITYGTEPMPESVLSKLETTFPGVKLLQTFGTSETGIVKTFSMSQKSTFIKISDENIQYKIENSELWLKSKTQVLGYLNADMSNFTEDGWYKTGDIVQETDDGYLKIVGRINEIINVGGLKVLPVEVESVLLQMSEIEDCTVKAAKNPITGQMVIADVVLKEETSNMEIKKKIREYCKNRLDNYKVPVKINIVEKTNFGDRFKKIRRSVQVG